MSTIPRLGVALSRNVATSLDALAHRLEHRAGSGPDGTSHWFTLTAAQLAERAPLLRNVASRLDTANSQWELEAALASARSLVQDILATARVYHVAPKPKARRLSWLLDGTTTVPVDLNPNEMRWALREVNLALQQLAPNCAQPRYAA